MRTILIVQGERDGRQEYIISHLAKRWMMMGFRVINHHGPNDLPPADIAVLHVDKTVVPRIYHEALANYPVVVNRNILDISRKRYSHLRLTPDSDYAGAVIIKTNANYGGIPEYSSRVKQHSSRLRHILSSVHTTLLNLHLMKRPFQSTWSTRKTLNPMQYPIFINLKDVPHGAWKNPNLIIEKFCPELEGQHFFVRYWSFFGDRSGTGRYGSRNPIVKFSNMATEDIAVEIPSNLIEKRRELEIDYGRFDFVVHDNQTILLDVNKTLAGGSTLESYGDYLDNLAQGIKSYF
jgi:hypothetical protein